MTLSTINWTHVGFVTVVACSALHNLLPPWDFLKDFPRTQKVYKALVYVIGYIALNWRSTLWQTLSTQNGQRPSTAALNAAPSLTEVEAPVQTEQEKKP